MLLMKTKESIAQVFVWCADSSLPESEENLSRIRHWWSSLHGKTIVWEVFGGTVDSTTLVFRELVVVENALLEDSMLRWRKRGLKNDNAITVQHLVLDSSFQQLDIIPCIQDWFGCKYRVKVLD